MKTICNDIFTDKHICKSESKYFSIEQSIDSSLFFVVSSIGRLKCRETYNTFREAGERNDYLLIWVLNGVLEAASDGINRAVAAGELLIIDCSKKHYYRADSDKTEFIYVHFSGGNCADMVKKIFAAYPTKLDNRFFHADVNAVLPLIERININADVTEHEVSVLIYAVLCELINADKQSLSVIHSQIVQQAVSIINKQPGRVQHIAKLLSVSPQYLTRKFNLELNMSTKEYIIHRRLNTACALLSSSPMTVENIAVETMFNSTSNFIKAFTKFYGMTPHTYRKRRFKSQ